MVGDKIYPNQMDQSRTYPSVVYKVNTAPVLIKELDGPSKTTLQVNLHFKDFEKGKRAVEIVKKLLNGYRGTHEGNQIYQCLYDGDSEDTIDEVESTLFPTEFNLIHQ